MKLYVHKPERKPKTWNPCPVHDDQIHVFGAHSGLCDCGADESDIVDRIVLAVVLLIIGGVTIYGIWFG